MIRERFLGVKSLRVGCLIDKGCYSYLYFIIFEFWYIVMNFFLLIFNIFYNEKFFDKGIMNVVRIKFFRNIVKKEV